METEEMRDYLRHDIKGKFIFEAKKIIKDFGHNTICCNYWNTRKGERNWYFIKQEFKKTWEYKFYIKVMNNLEKFLKRIIK